MKYMFALLLTFILVGCGELSTNGVYEKVKDGTVLIENKMEKAGAIGTGFILDENMIVTNNHVIRDSQTLTVYSRQSEKKYEAVVVYKDEIADIAVLRLRDWDLYNTTERPTILSLGDSDTAKVGDGIVVVGHPWGLTWSVSEGIISAKNRRIGQNPKFIDQVDAHLFNGNSGGPIFDKRGNVVCVSNLMLSQEGGSYGFCIPSNLLKKVLYDFNTFHEIRWRVLNVAVGSSDDGYNVVLKSIDPEGAAAKAGLKEGDKVVKIETPKTQAEGIVVKDTDTLINELAKLNGDEDTVLLTVERDGTLLSIKVLTNYKLSKEYEPDKVKN